MQLQVRDDRAICRNRRLPNAQPESTCDWLLSGVLDVYPGEFKSAIPWTWFVQRQNGEQVGAIFWRHVISRARETSRWQAEKDNRGRRILVGSKGDIGCSVRSHSLSVDAAKTVDSNNKNCQGPFRVKVGHAHGTGRFQVLRPFWRNAADGLESGSQVNNRRLTASRGSAIPEVKSLSCLVVGRL